MALLDVQDLHIRLQTPRGPADAVRGLSFSLDKGDALGLIGESGCGKSLTVMALMGLLPEGAQVRGSIRFEGQELVGLDESQLCRLRGDRLAMIFQEPMTALNPVHTIGHQVAEPLRLHRGMGAAAARTEAIALLDRVGIPNAAQRVDAYPHQFSGGQRQRITIAMALACNPDLLIADEPTTALDVTVQRQILDLINDLVDERGMALMLISHDLGVIANNVDRMAPPYTRGLFAARPRLGPRPPGPRAALATIAGTVPELVDLPAGCAFAGRCALSTAQCEQQRPVARQVGSPDAAQGLSPHLVSCWHSPELPAEAQV